MSGLLNLVKIYDISRGDDFITQLQNWGLLPTDGSYKCPKCQKDLKLCPTTKVDGYSWRCRAMVSLNKQKPKKCDTEISIRTGTFFAGSHLSIFQILGFVNLWVDNVPLHIIGKQLSIEDTMMSSRTCVDWASFCREVVYDGMILKKEKIGGEGKTAQVDEAKFGKRKFNRGHRIEGQWVFGGYEVGTGRVFMVPVEKRDAQTLVPIIKEWILPGTTIVSDYWKAYDCLEMEGFKHLKVNHSVTFKDPESGAHTNNIEASWRAAKVTMYSGARKKNYFPSHLAKYMFMKMCRQQSFDPTAAFFKMAGELYSPIKPNEETELRDYDNVDTENHDFD